MSDADPNVIREETVKQIRTIKDPEIPVNIYDLGLIYDIDINDACDVVVTMTLTSPNCPVAESLPNEVRNKVAAVDGVKSAEVKVTWDPPWSPEMMSDNAKLALDYEGGGGFMPGPRPFTSLSVGRTQRPDKRS